MMFPQVYKYAGSPKNLTVCPAENYNDPNDTCVYSKAEKTMPPDEYAKCKCYKSCEAYEFAITGYDKMRYSPGN